MANPLRSSSSLAKRWELPFSVILSGGCWYFGNGLTGDYWYLVWMAPVPLLLVALTTTYQVSYWVAFTALLAGRFSWFSYLQTVTGTGLALLILLGLTLVYVRFITETRRMVLSSGRWYTAFAYPAFVTAFEYGLFRLSPDGTATSLAYSQANVLPLIQVASVAGLLGITFLVSFVPSSLGVGWWLYHQKKPGRGYLASSVLVLLGVTLLYGISRTRQRTATTSLRVGLVTLEQGVHHRVSQATPLQVRSVVVRYGQEIGRLAAGGAGVVVLTEGALRLRDEAYRPTIAYLGDVARRNRVYMVVGCTYTQDRLDRNAALVFDPTGQVVATYHKAHLVRGFEDAFTPGKQIGVFPFDTIRAGVAICKDLDFSSYIRQYGRARAGILFVPANDFEVDDWLHSRMAMLRGVENGFAMVRAARHGRLTLSDHTGRILGEALTVSGQKTTLSGPIPLVHYPTFYTQTGDWLGIGCLILTAIFILISRRQGLK